MIKRLATWLLKEELDKRFEKFLTDSSNYLEIRVHGELKGSNPYCGTCGKLRDEHIAEARGQLKEESSKVADASVEGEGK